MYTSIFLICDGCLTIDTMGFLKGVEAKTSRTTIWISASAGSLIVFLKCLGFNYDQIVEKIIELDCITGIVYGGSLEPGASENVKQEIEKWMENILESKKIFGKDVTLKEIYKAWEEVDPDNIEGHRFNFHPTSYWEDIFNNGGWQNQALDVQIQTQYYPTAMVALNSIRMAGVKNSLNAGRKSLTGRKLFSQFVNELEKLKEPKGIPLTYEIILLKARKLNL